MRESVEEIEVKEIHLKKSEIEKHTEERMVSFSNEDKLLAEQFM